MLRNVWKKCQNAVCQISFYSSAGIKISSMTGFKANDHYIITDESLYKVYKAEDVKISFVRENGYTEDTSVRIPMSEFKKRILKGINNEKSGFAAIYIDFKEFKNIPSLKLSKANMVDIGQPVGILGYQLDKDNLAVKTGVISSAFKSNSGLEYYQVDASFKQGNSGSPLVNMETCEVVGIIGNRLAKVAQSHKRMKQIINNNLAILKKSQGKFNVEEIDPIQVLIANQNQIKYISNEIYKNVTMSTGYALNVIYVHEFFEEFIDAEVSQSLTKLQVDV